MTGNVIQPNGAVSGSNYIETGIIRLDQLSWTLDTGGMYYATVPNVFPSGKKAVGGFIYNWYNWPSNFALSYTQSVGNPLNLIIISSTNNFASEARIAIRISIV